LNPDAWNNIPICLVKAIKTLVEANISTDQRMRNLQGQTENNVRKALSHIQKVEKDLLKKEEQLKVLIERTDKNLNAALAAKSNELDAHIRSVREAL
jgi:ribosomal protein S13